MPDQRLLVDARSVTHPTAGGRGIGNYTLGLLHGLQTTGADFAALVAHPNDAHALAGAIDPGAVELWRRDVVRALASDGSWYVATGLFLHPISFDPIPQVITEARLPVAGVLYDVIPYRYPDRYLIDENAARQARLRAPLARTVDLMVAISQFSADTAVDVLGLDPSRLRVIGAGVEPRFVPPEGRSSRGAGGVVAVTGPDPRKNTEGLLRAWSLVPPELRKLHPMVVVVGAGGALVDEWHALAAELGVPEVRFEPAVSEVQMVELLQQAWLVVQPSVEEGFGLPVVEAAACGAPVICSNTSSLPEVLDEPEALFDPHDPNDIARAIERGLVDAPHRGLLLGAGVRAAARWRWDRVATDLLRAIEEVHPIATVRSPWRRLAVIIRPADQPVADALAAAFDGEVVTLVDPSEGAKPLRPEAPGSMWPAAALGRYVKYHEFDHVVAILDAHDQSGVAARVARDLPVHVWYHGGIPPTADVPPLARSVAVAPETPAGAARVLATTLS